MRGGLPLKKEHPSYKAINSLQKVWSYERGNRRDGLSLEVVPLS
jgi:hypothetical protein